MHFRWRGHVLFGDGRKLAEVVPDDRWPGMYRVRDSEGQLSDMANLSWAKAAAITIAGRAAGVVESDPEVP